MTGDNDQQHIKDAVNGWSMMQARQVDRNIWHVVSWRNDSNTVHRVDRTQHYCTCKDKQFNLGDEEVCDHFMKVEYSANKSLAIDDYATAHLSDLVARAHEAVQKLEDCRDVAQANQKAHAAQKAADASSDDSADSDGTPGGALDGIHSWLESRDVETEHLEIDERQHNGTGGIAIHPDNQEMSDKEYNWLKDVYADDVPSSDWHLGFADEGCPNCEEEDEEFFAFVPAGDLPKVVE